MKTTKICLFCAKSFEGGPKALYCSTSHRVLGNREKKGVAAPIWSGQTSPDVADLKKEVKALKRTQTNHLAEIDNLNSIIVDLKEVIEGLEERAGKTEIEPQNEDLGPLSIPPAPTPKKKFDLDTLRPRTMEELLAE